MKRAIGDLFKVIDNDHTHGFKIGEIVRFTGRSHTDGSWTYENEDGLSQYVLDIDLKPRKITGAEYFILDDSCKHGESYNTIVTLHDDDGSQSPVFMNEDGEKVSISMHDVILLDEYAPYNVQDDPESPFYRPSVVFDDELDDLIGTLSSYTIPTEHRPRDNTNFTLTINEQALNDDIPFIIDAYYTANLSLREVGSLLGVDEATIRRRMKKHNVPTRTVSQALRAKYSL